MIWSVGSLTTRTFLRIDRRSGVYSHGTFTDYPFQVNTHGLPKRVVRECLMGFADTLQQPIDLGADPSFAQWARATFGEGICNHFMIPYNEKLFCSDLETITADWVSWSIPEAHVGGGCARRSADQHKELRLQCKLSLPCCWGHRPFTERLRPACARSEACDARDRRSRGRGAKRGSRRARPFPTRR